MGERDHKNLKGFLRELEIYGYDQFESFILYSLITGMPILFVGPHGTGKTLLAERISRLLGLKFHAYDASKALFEDLVGFPDIESMKKGKLEYVKGEMTLWDKEFILIDEISRALPGLQNKWLEVIRSRRLMGVPLSNLKYIFAAMNPPTYIGAMPLDEALADRFAFIINFQEPPEEYLENILKVKTHDDAPLLFRKDGIKENSEFKNALQKLKTELKKRLNNSEDIRKLVLFLATAWKREFPDYYISPRRWKMIYYNLTGIKLLEGDLYEENFANTVINSLPFHATSDQFGEKEIEKIKELLHTVFKYFKENPEKAEGVSSMRKKKKNPFILNSMEDGEKLIDLLKRLSENWESETGKESWVFFTTVKRVVENISLGENLLILEALNNSPLPLPPHGWGLYFLMSKIYGKSNLEPTEDEVLQQVVEKFYAGGEEK